MHSINFYNFEERKDYKQGIEGSGENCPDEVEKQFLAGRQSIQQFITSRKDRRKGKTRSE